MRRADIERLLPGVYRSALEPPRDWDLEPDRKLGAVLDSMEQMHHPIEEVLDDIDAFIDPRRTRAAFVPYLCGWLDLEWLLLDEPAQQADLGAEPIPGGLGHLREVVAVAAELSRGRGTQRGLSRFLETATGVSGFSVVEGRDARGRSIPFHITVRVPPAAAPQRMFIEHIVLEEKPAYVTHELDMPARAVEGPTDA